MKKTEIAMIILIASVSMFATFLIARTLLGDSIKREKTVPVVTEVKDELVPPSKLIFNDDAINPTVEVYVDQDVGAAGESSPQDAATVPTQPSTEAETED